MLSERTGDNIFQTQITGDYARLRASMHSILSVTKEAFEVDAAKQTRLESFIEAWINVAIGFVINFAGNWFILPLVGFTTLSVKDNFIIGFLFTIISVTRQYVIRRWAQDHLRRFKVATAATIRGLLNR